MERGRTLGKRILLADDEAGVRAALKMVLRVDQHSVTEARDGREALDLFAPGRFDLVITDYSMPRMQGDEVAINIRRLAPGQPIIMITAHADQLRGTNNPVDAILSKPFTFEDLRQTISRLLSDPEPPSTKDSAPE